MNFFQYFNRKDPAHVQGFHRVHATDPGHPYTKAWWPSGHIIGYEHLFVHEVYDFLNNLGTKQAPYSTFEDAVKRTKNIAGIHDANLIEYQQRFDLSDFFRLFGQTDSKVVKVDLGMDMPKLQAGQLYFLSPTFLH